MKFRHFIWIICLSFLSVGARNFENGLSLDAPLYATISRNIINSGEWFHLDPFLNEFKPYYAEHPHLGFWIQAIIFKAVGAADWSARISGHLYYLAFMCLFFFALMSISGEIVATLAVLLLWVLAPFANFFSSFFLDPGCLFWGSCFLFSLWKSVNNYSFKWAFLSGLSLALSFMTKGLTILAFGPAAVFILFSQRKNLLQNFKYAALSLLSFLLIVLVYFFSIKGSVVPDFLNQYWYRQMTNRFSGSYRLIRLSEFRFWKALIKDSYFLFPLLLISVHPKFLKSKGILFCWTLIITFVLMFAPTERIGGQYFLMIYPWMAWIIAITVGKSFIKSPEKWQKHTQFLAVSAVLLLQYAPIQTHKSQKAQEIALIEKWKEKYNPQIIYFFQSPNNADFMNTAPLTWYTNLRFEMLDKNSANVTPSAHANEFFLYRKTEGLVEKSDEQKWTQLGWCLLEGNSKALLFSSDCRVK